jgi:hypothetical protein
LQKVSTIDEHPGFVDADNAKHDTDAIIATKNTVKNATKK